MSVAIDYIYQAIHLETGKKIDKAVIRKILNHLIEFVTYCLLFNFNLVILNLGRFYTKWYKSRRSNGIVIVEGHWIPKIQFATQFLRDIRAGQSHFKFPALLQDVCPISSSSSSNSSSLEDSLDLDS